MEAEIILKIAGIGMLVAAASQILSRAGRDDQAMLVSLAGIVLVLLIVLEKISGMFTALRSMFGL
ncbi:MAG: stage III sporulation protein AC [Clostridia bacterium]|nr:stage III sporulation protein AC [Clostridia bacterium]